MNISKENVITMACSDGQLRPGKGIQAEKVKVKTLRKVA